MRIIFCLSFFFAINLLFGQQVTGRIIDNQGQPLFGVHVYWNDNMEGVSTDESGSFSIFNNMGYPRKLVISFLGYQSLEINLSSIAVLGDLIMKPSSVLLDVLTIDALRINSDRPFAIQDFNKSTIQLRNLGQDIPGLLNFATSVVSTSDAGTGIGYSGIRIRGSDASRVNVTINGVPYNDSESQQVFWVDLPDIASSLHNIQIQRGVGVSTNGAGAFGASVHLNSLDNKKDAYIELENSFGSYNTRKHNLKFSTGLLQGKFSLNGRLSKLKSDGYIDRAFSDLGSYYLSGNYYANNSSFHLIHFSGKERTYQSWYGTPESRIKNDRESMVEHSINNGLTQQQTQNLLNSGRTYNFYTYDDQVDDYKQDHYQLHFLHYPSSNWSLKTSLHYTKGYGFFEEYREKDDYSSYGLSNPVINNIEILNSDFIRRRWLDNDFLGIVFNIRRENANSNLEIGGGANTYLGDHYGEIIWTQFADQIDIRDRYYYSEGDKTDINIYAKYSQNIADILKLYGDLQLRNVNHSILGTDNDLKNLNTVRDFLFLNPKIGVSYLPSAEDLVYSSISVANREPDRNDLINAGENQVKHESLYDLELGYKSKRKVKFEVNLYYMYYKNQLVLTGELNDVGAALRTNVPDSYRLGAEFSFQWPITKKFGWSANATFSQNRIKKFTEVLYDYTNGFEVLKNNFENSNISFSPSLISSNQLQYYASDQLSLYLNSKFVSGQFLDNTSNDARMISAYFVNDFMMSYDFRINGIRSCKLTFMVNNLLNELYESNGYTYSYIFDNTITENFYYPQAGRNVMIGLLIGI